MVVELWLGLSCIFLCLAGCCMWLLCSSCQSPLHMQANKHLKYLHALTHIIVVVSFRNVFCSPLTILAKTQLITNVVYCKCCGWLINWVHNIWKWILLASSTTGIKGGFWLQINKLNNFGLGYYLSAWDLRMSPIEVPMWNNYDWQMKLPHNLLDMIYFVHFDVVLTLALECCLCGCFASSHGKLNSIYSIDAMK